MTWKVLLLDKMLLCLYMTEYKMSFPFSIDQVNIFQIHLSIGSLSIKLPASSIGQPG